MYASVNMTYWICTYLLVGHSSKDDLVAEAREGFSWFHCLILEIGSHASPGKRASRVVLHVFPNCRLRQGIEAEPFAPAIESYCRKLLLAKHGDVPIPGTTARPGINPW